MEQKAQSKSSSFGVICAICSEFYTPYDVISHSASCGHIFHKVCLTRWLNISLTCPQCRASCHRDKIRRIYLNFSDREEGKLPVQWVPLDSNAKKLPKGVVKCGFDDKALCSWDCQAYEFFSEVEVLVLTDCDHKWVPGTKGSHSSDSLQTGYSEDGEVTYTGRGVYKGIIRLGKVHPSHEVMYIPHRGLEVNVPDYEVLVVNPR